MFGKCVHEAPKKCLTFARSYFELMIYNIYNIYMLMMTSMQIDPGFRCLGETIVPRNLLVIQWEYVSQCSNRIQQQWGYSW